jgi:hypothetical protein
MPEVPEKESLITRVRKQFAKFWQGLGSFFKRMGTFFGWKRAVNLSAQDQNIPRISKGTIVAQTKQPSEQTEQKPVDTPSVQGISPDIQQDIDAAEKSMSELAAFKEANSSSLAGGIIKKIEKELSLLKTAIEALRSHPVKDSSDYNNVKNISQEIIQLQQQQETQIAEKIQQEHQQRLQEKYSELYNRTYQKVLEADNLLTPEGYLLPDSKKSLVKQRSLVDSLNSKPGAVSLVHGRVSQLGFCILV